jgi:hypothetical protein
VVPTRPTAGHLRDWFLLGSGPLKRGSDRLEALIRALLAGWLVAVVPLALVAASSVYSQTRARAEEQAQDRHRVAVTLLAGAPEAAPNTWGGPPIEPATGEWTDPAGVAHELTLGVPAGATVGTTVHVWVDRDGARTSPPISADAAPGAAIALGAFAWGGLSLLGLGAYSAVRACLERVRSRRWATEWATVEPVWTRRVP